MDKDEAIALALEALEREEYRLRQTGQSQVYSGIGFAITAIKQALALDKMAEEYMIYKTFEQWKSGNVLEHGVPRIEHYSEDQLDLVEMGWKYGYDAGRAVEQALDKMAENARELGLDYEPADGTQVSKVWWDGEKLMAKPIPLVDLYQPAPVQEPVAYRSRLASGNYTYCTTPQFFDNAQPLYTTPPAAAVQEGRDWSLFEATQESLREHMVEIKRLKEAQPAVPDAIGPNEDELPAYAAGWNDCRAEMLKGMK